MKAAVWHGPRDIRVEQYPDPPPPGPGELRVAVAYAGICGTDVHEYLSGPVFIPFDRPHPLTGHKGPTILGHEMSGTVLEVGPGVTGFAPGDRVVSDIVLYCGQCHMCRRGLTVLCVKGGSLGLQSATGGFGQYVTMPAYSAYKLPPEIPLDIGAMVEPLATSIRGLRQGRITPGDRVGVVGAGAIGLFGLQAARLGGAREVYMIARGEEKKRIAAQVGATAVIDSEDRPIEEIYDLTDGEGLDLVLEAAGTEAGVSLALRAAGKTGRVVLLGIFGSPAKTDLNELVFYEKEVIGSLGRYPRDMRTAMSYLASGRVQAQPLIARRVPLDAIVEQGFEALVNERGRHVKILVAVGA